MENRIIKSFFFYLAIGLGLAPVGCSKQKAVTDIQITVKELLSVYGGEQKAGAC